MEAVAVYAVQSLLFKCRSMVENEIHMESEVKDLKMMMEMINSIIADTEGRNILDKMSLQRWLKELKSVEYEWLDIVDLWQLSVMERFSGNLSVQMRAILIRHHIGRRIRALNKRLHTLGNRYNRFKFIQPSDGHEGHNTVHGSRETTVTYQSGLVVVKIEQDTRKLVRILTDDMASPNNNIMVVAVVGMAGVGKTTLAQMVFRDMAIKDNFDLRIWLCVTQHINIVQLLKDAILGADGELPDPGESNNMPHLLSALAGTIRQKKFLLVLDDIWNEQVWLELLFEPFSHGARGSRVLITTRNGAIARQMGAVQIHHVYKLEPEDAWSLFKQVTSTNESDIHRLKSIGTKIIEKCDGLPLAIKEIGAILRNTYPRQLDWEYISQIEWSVNGLPEQLYNSLYLSYMYLHSALKKCFLYYSLLPEDGSYDRRTVINLWISEGFIQDKSSTSRSLEEIGMEYHQELIMNNLIEPAAESIPGLFFTMHKVVRSFAQFVAGKEALVVETKIKQTDISKQLSETKLWHLSIESTELIPEWAVVQKQVTLRTLIINCTEKFKHGDSFTSFPSLRVLRIRRLPGSDRLVNSLCQLKHLRYLQFCDTDISRLPDDIDKMKFLQHIGVVNCEKFVQLPGSFIKLSQLRSLDLSGSNVGVIPRGFGGLTNLRLLYGFPVYVDRDWCSLQELVPLSQLRNLKVEGLEKVNAANTSAATASEENETEQLIQEVLFEFCPPICLKTLVMDRCIKCELPHWMWAPKASDFRDLKYMELHNLTSCTQLPDGLCLMRSLQRLEINKAPRIEYVGPEFLHQLQSQEEGAFPRLQELVLIGMVQWNNWEWEVNLPAMPALEVLVVESCKLERFPPGLSFHARSLKRLALTCARHLKSLDNFCSVVELDICFSPELSMISNMPRLQKLTIKICPMLRVLKGVTQLHSLAVEDYEMKTLPGYLQSICPRDLSLDCSLKLLTSISKRADGPEWHKLTNIQRVKAYAEDHAEDEVHLRKWYVFYTKDTDNFDTNIDHSSTRLEADPDDSDELDGVDMRLDNIIKLLKHDEETGKKQPKIVCIYGSEGLGKTTVAKEVYKKIGGEFQHRAFVPVAREPDKEKIMITSILDQVRCPYPNSKESDNQQTLIQEQMERLKEFLQQSRYLIVLDDIWDASLWEMIKPALLTSSDHKSGIIVTTCNSDVAGSIGGVYKLPLLSYKDSKRLFYRGTYFGTESRCPSEYREVSDRILNKCAQLPLAIITISNLVSSGLPEIDEWRKVCNSIGTGLEIDDSLKDMRDKLSRSYEVLPVNLKPCLLYLGIFPEDYVIRKDSLVQRWISEGLIGEKHEQKTQNLQLQQKGESYFYQLLDMGMIQPIEFDSDGKALTCHVPVVILDLIMYLLKKEGVNNTSGGQLQTERLSMQVSNGQHFSEISEINIPADTPRQARSIFCSVESMTVLSTFQNLHVLLLEGLLDNRHISKYIVGLPQLTYLCLLSTGVTEIPKKIGKLRSLETLDLRGTSVKELPSTVVHLKKLRSLLVNRCTKVPAGIGKLQALEELADIDICNSTDVLKDICSMPDLRVLRIALWSWDESYSKRLAETLRKLSTEKLKELTIFTCCLLDFRPDDIQPALKKIEKIEIRGSTFNTLPNWIDKLRNLNSLSIEVYLLGEEALGILGELPDLEFLSLAAKKTSQGRVGGENLAVGSLGFDRLKTFLLFSRAIGIKFEKGSMRKLENLELSFQASLMKKDQVWDFGLENLSSLKHAKVEIICFSATDEVVNKAEGAIRKMIAKNPIQPRPALNIKRTVKEYMLKDENVLFGSSLARFGTAAKPCKFS